MTGSPERVKGGGKTVPDVESVAGAATVPLAEMVESDIIVLRG
jgi:hypothetical protein